MIIIRSVTVPSRESGERERQAAALTVHQVEICPELGILEPSLSS